MMGGVSFVAVGRIEDHVRLAYHLKEEMRHREQDLIGMFTNLLRRYGDEQQQQQRRFDWEGGHFSILTRGMLLYCAFTPDMSFPDGLVYQMLSSLHQHINAQDLGTCATEDCLIADLSPKLKELAEEFEAIALQIGELTPRTRAQYQGMIGFGGVGPGLRLVDRGEFADQLSRLGSGLGLPVRDEGQPRSAHSGPHNEIVDQTSPRTAGSRLPMRDDEARQSQGGPDHPLLESRQGRPFCRCCSSGASCAVQ